MNHDEMVNDHLKEAIISEVMAEHRTWMAQHYRHEAIRWHNNRVAAAICGALDGLGGLAEGMTTLRTDITTRPPPIVVEP